MVEGGGGGRVQPGTYPYVIVESVEKKFRSGNFGLELKLNVLVGDRGIPVYERIPYLTSLAWKIRKFAASVGFDPQRSPDAHKLIGMQGRAEFVKDAKGWLELDEFLPKGENVDPVKSAAKVVAAPIAVPLVSGPVGDDVPF
tara:strand:- start:1138 stop:1563 length:426 start_codon:yes stop_codon:yes gene_type:complete